MNIGAILIGLAIVVLAFSYVASPFGNQKKEKGSRGKVPERNSGSKNLQWQEQAVLKKLRDLDFDYQTGKVSEEDYQPLRYELVAEAARLIEVMKQEEAQIEERPRSRQQAKAEKEICLTCGGDLKLEDLFCPACGQPLVAACLKCGRTIHPGDLFCPGCGSPVKKYTRAAVLNQV